MTTPIAHKKPWRLDRKAVLVHAPHFDDIGCLAHVNTLREGFITIKMNLKLAGFNDEYRTFHLNILPGAINECSVICPSYNNLLPTELSRKLRGVNKASAAVTIILQLNKPSVVLAPLDVTMDSIAPTDPTDGDFHAISQISRATSIRLHYSKQDFPISDQLQFRAFGSALAQHALGAPGLNYNHFNGGTGAQERDWTIFDRKPRLPTYEQAVAPDTVLGKRSRAEDLTPDPTLHAPCSPSPGSPTEVGTSFEADSPIKDKELYETNTHSAHTRKTARPLRQTNNPTKSSACRASTTSISLSPVVSISSQDSWEVPLPTIIPTVFYSKLARDVESFPRQKGRKEVKTQIVVEEPRGPADNAIMDNAATQTYIREIVCKIARDVVDEEKQTILDEHQEICDEAELRIAEAIEDARLTIIEKTDESCEVINEHSAKLEEAYVDSYEIMQTEVACLQDASTGMEKALGRLLGALDAGTSSASSAKMSSAARFQPAAHPSARAAQIIQNDYKSLDMSTKVSLLTTIADEGYANVFVTVNSELRKELITAWTKESTRRATFTTDS
ncbi:hypothetical protein E4T47_09348 [Aureobasidium subglaciale]|nr:hypothetical protein E4T47_09348 [Aureobasidium subglaciale]